MGFYFSNWGSFSHVKNSLSHYSIFALFSIICLLLPHCPSCIYSKKENLIMNFPNTGIRPWFSDTRWKEPFMMETCSSWLRKTIPIGSSWRRITYTVRICMSPLLAQPSQKVRGIKIGNFWIEKLLQWFKCILIEICLSMCPHTQMLMSCGQSLNIWFKRKLQETKHIL